MSINRLAPAALAAESAAEPNGTFKACLKSVSVLGASMGHSEIKSKDGRQLYRFTLRTAGLDYVADCDAATGSIGDVVPRMAAPAADAS